MAQTFDTVAGDGIQGVQSSYPLLLDAGVVGQVADMSEVDAIGGMNETASWIPYGIPLVRNGSGVAPNSCQPITAAGSLLGFSLRTNVRELGSRDANPAYRDGVPPKAQVNILKKGTILIEVFEAVAPGDALRYFKSGTNAGKFGKTASAGNSLLFTAGSWEIRKGAAAGGLLRLHIDTPAAIALTADT